MKKSKDDLSGMAQTLSRMNEIKSELLSIKSDLLTTPPSEKHARGILIERGKALIQESNKLTKAELIKHAKK